RCYAQRGTDHWSHFAWHQSSANSQVHLYQPVGKDLPPVSGRCGYGRIHTSAFPTLWREKRCSTPWRCHMKVEMIPELKNAWKMISMWAFLALGLLPELLALAASFDLVPDQDVPRLLDTLIKLIAFAGAAGRLIKQAA